MLNSSDDTTFRRRAFISRMTSIPEKPSDVAGTSQPAAPVPWTDRFTVGRMAVLIALFLFVLYPGVILGTHSFFHRDFGLFTYPVACYTRQSLWHGAIPLWNPLNNAGVPFLAQWNTTVCYPPSLIYLLLPLPWSLNLFCLGHLVLAGVGMYLLARDWTGNRLAAGVAGLAFALGGLMLNCLIWTSNLAALSWEPLVILCVERAWRRGGRQVAVAALAAALQMLSGAPEIIVFTWILLFVIWAWQAARNRIPLWPSLRRFVIVVALVAALAAIQLLPFLDLLAHSKRNPSYDPGAWHMPIWGWGNLVVPMFHCSPTALGDYFQQGQSWTSSYYTGIGVLALALVGIWKSCRPRAWLLAAASLAGWVLALGNSGYIYTWLRMAVPWIGFARYPIKFVALPAFAIPLLAAYGFTRIHDSPAPNARRSGRILAGAAAVLLAGIIVTLVEARLHPLAGDSWTATWQSGLSSAFFLLSVTGILALLTRAQTASRRLVLGTALLMLIGLDAVTAGLHENPTVTTKAFGPMQPPMTPVPRPGQSRAMVSNRSAAFFGRADTANPLYYYAGVRGALFKNCNLLENIPKVNGFWSLHLAGEMEINSLWYGPGHFFPAGLADFLGVSQISAPDDPFAWTPRHSFLPLITAGQHPVFADARATLKALSSGDFDPRRTVYLPESARGTITATDTATASIQPGEFSAERVRFKVEVAAPAMVVIAQSFYHDWHARVDGRPAQLWRANLAYQCLEVPAGQHEITLVYQDRAFAFGAVISLAALAGCLAILWRKWQITQSLKR